MKNTIIKMRAKRPVVAGQLMTTDDVAPIARKYQWYDFVQLIAGMKWAATIIVIGNIFIDHWHSDGLRYAAIILGLFLFVEWAQLTWREFKRGN